MTARRPGVGAALAALVTVALVGCGSPAAPAPDVVPTPTAVATPAPEADVVPWALPFAWEDAEAVDPGWDRRPQELDGWFLGVAVPDEPDAPVRFTATDSHGEVLWRADRPRAAAGYALSRAGGRPVAVLTDAADGDMPLTATAYDLASGSELWGPVPIPGPHVDPGLVFAPEGAGDSVEGRLALDAMSGEEVALPPSATVIGEYDGTVVVGDGGEVQAWDAATAAVRWRVPVADLGIAEGATPTALDGSSALRGAAVVGAAADDDAEAVGGLLDLSTGQVVATGAREAAWDGAVRAWVVLGPAAVSAYRAEGEQLWSHAATPDMSLAAAGGALVYLRDGDRLRLRNTLTGAEAVAYGDPGSEGYAVPALVGATGAAVVRTHGYVLLTTTAPGDGGS